MYFVFKTRDSLDAHSIERRISDATYILIILQTKNIWLRKGRTNSNCGSLLDLTVFQIFSQFALVRLYQRKTLPLIFCRGARSLFPTIAKRFSNFALKHNF